MGYERQDRRHGRDYRPGGFGSGSYGGDRHPGGQRDYRDRYGQPQGYDYEDRGFFDRAGDEVRSWFGDEEAERRRRLDERHAQRDWERGHGGWGERGHRDASGRDYAGRDYGRGGYGRSYEGSAHGTGGYGSTGSRSSPYASRGTSAILEQGYGASDYRGGHDHDPHYRNWRDRQLQALDRDYDEYRRENQSRFESDFGSWRSTRETQRGHLRQVQEHQEVVGSDGGHVGTVDKVRGDRIILTRNDQDAGGRHHSIPCSWIKTVGDKVEIAKTADEAHAHWRDEERSTLFGRDDDRWDRDRDDDHDGGPHVLGRSFSGTY